MNVGEYNTFDLVKIIQRQKPCILLYFSVPFVPSSREERKRKAIMYLSSPDAN
jgi:arginine utilization protein RocB